MGEEIEEEAVQLARPRGRHIKKRALKNKALAVSFNEKHLKDYVSGFHKRKKKRRKEAQKQQEKADRRKRIEQRKKRKFEKEQLSMVEFHQSLVPHPMQVTTFKKRKKMISRLHLFLGQQHMTMAT
ncbi:uncharacterized protein LOC121258071 [Juglans microcarpa x Juglans regia]|uniref:uncharacterized protein LOC121258071 n=1 Tax=Juglans microcarpa x Juglans regia TaxID=2249226 RepID=UPI001B7E2558|nr:uncharacterized protein LOC121258071 [Juglans microcarpa x Juglans regia]